MDFVHRASALILKEKQLLLVREKGKDYFVTPGGEYHDGESAEACLRRELQEEIGAKLESLEYFHTYEFEQSRGRKLPLVMDCYQVEISGDPQPASEIEEWQWVTKEDIAEQRIKVAESFYTWLPDVIDEGWL